MVVERDARLENFITEFANARPRVCARFQRILLFYGKRVTVLKNVEIKIRLVGKYLGAQVTSVDLR